MTHSIRSILVGYGAAALGVAAALLLTLLFTPLHVTPFLLFLMAVLMIAWLYGPGPGLFAVALSLAVVYQLFLDAATPASDQPAYQRVTTFLMMALLLVWFADKRRRAEAKLREHIAELRRADEALQSSERRFEGFLRHLPGLAWIKDLGGRYVYANEAASTTFGRTHADLYGRTDEEIFPLETAQQFRDNDRRALAREAGIRFVESLQHEDGTTHFSMVSKFPIPGADGMPALVGGMAIDVTEQKRAEDRVHALNRELQHEQELLHRIMDTIPVMIAMYDPHARLIRLNNEFTNVLGWTPEEATGVSLMDACYPDPEYRAWVRGYMESCRPGWTDMRMHARDGRVVDTSWANIRISDNTQVGIGIEITERKRAEEALREADRRKDEFIATLSHELRNPLAPIRAGLEILRLSGAGGREHQRVLQRVESQVAQLVRLIDDLLDVTRIRTGKIELRRERVDLSVVVGDAIEMMRPFVEASGHELTVTLPPEPIQLQADRTRIAQVLTNLLNNAAKFTQRGGRISLNAARENGNVILSVRDTGIGIPADMLSSIFDMFTQVDRSLERTQDGLGIGLSLVRALVELHGGTVEARSDGKGQGSEFVVRLPVITEEAWNGDAPAQYQPRRIARFPARRILVVDDNEDAAESLALLLELMGQNVNVAHSGPAALELAASFQPGVVLLDIGMPGMNGYEVARQIRDQPGLRETILVAVTGWGQEEDRRRSREAGFHRHLVKPIDASILQELLASLGTAEPSTHAAPT